MRLPADSMTTPAPVAAIDCGTNSIRLLVARPEGDRLVDLDRRMRTVRLGQGVDATGRLAPDALERTFAVCEDYRALIREHGAERIRFAATSATRDADNSAEFVSGVADRLGVRVEVLSGDQEARLTFEGARRYLAAPTPMLACDIGGGSTEFIVGDTVPRQWWSADIGCVRLAERHVSHDPPTDSEVRAIRRDVNEALDRVRGHVDLESARSVIGLAGTVTTVTALALRLDSYDPDRIHGASIRTEQVDEVVDRLVAMSAAERAALGPMHPGRVDVIATGAIIWQEVARAAKATEVIASERDILDGLALSIAES